MGRTTVWLWLALVGAVLQIVSLGSDFYLVDGERRMAWFGVPHTSELILLSALATTSLFVLTAAGRAPLPGRGAGLAVAGTGLIASLQLVYRMVAPPFGGEVPDHAGILGAGCLYYCLPSEAQPADLLTGIWIALAGCVLVVLGGLAHAVTRTAAGTPATTWATPAQPEMTPWLGLAALGAVGHFVFGYTFFTFFAVVREAGVTTWSGWLSMPHTGSMVVGVAVVVVALAWSAGRRRSPLRAAPLGALIAVLGLVTGVRTGYRILQPPFGSSDIVTVEIGPAAWLAMLCAALVVVAGLVQAVSGRDRPPIRAEGRA